MALSGDPGSHNCLGAVEFIYAKGWLQTAAGRVGVEWRASGDKVFIEIDMPEGANGIFELGGSERNLNPGKNRLTAGIKDFRKN